MLCTIEPPKEPLHDECITLRMPVAGDVSAVAGYAHEEGGLDGIWLPLAPGSPQNRCTWDEVSVIRTLSKAGKPRKCIIQCSGDTFVYHTVNPEIVIEILPNPLLRINHTN